MDYMPYSSDMEHHAQQPAQKAAGKWAMLVKIGIFLSILVLGAGSVYWVAQKFPDKMKNLLISIDRFGITTVGAAEQQRVRTINRLRITYEEKQVLIKRTVFLGATREMVYLALGDPVCVLQVPQTAQQPSTEAWIYYIDGDRRPTQLSFQSNELVGAGKTSALDSCK